MRVLFVGEDIQRSKGGIVTVMKQLLHNPVLKESVDYKTVFTTGDAYSATKKIIGWVRAFLQLLYYLPSCKIVHIHHASNLNFWLSAAMAHLAKLFGRKVILHNHGADFKLFYDGLSKSAQKRIERAVTRVDANIVLSRSWQNWYRSIAPRANWVVLPNSVNIPADVPAKKIGQSGISLVYLARIEERKGFFDMMNMLPGLLEQFRNCKLYVAGQGDTDMVKNKAQELNLADKIEVLGYIDYSQKDQLLRKGHVLLLPSYEEGLPMALLEAMSYGMVPVTTPVGGIPEVIVHGENGMLLQPGDTVAMRNCVEWVIGDAGRFEQMSRNASETIALSFNLHNHMKDLLGIYKSFSAEWN
jgi:Glycosyltransferase